MELVTYGWIGACVVAPTISAVCIVVLFLFNVYKSQWKNVDHFLVGLTVQEIISSVLCFALSILNLLHNRNEQLCGLITGLWFAIRALQLVTLTSLAVDRALILKWPYQYRFSVRSLQITGHLVFVSFCCSSIALFAYSARLDQPTIQSIISDLPTGGGLSANLAYFDLFSNPLFGNDRYGDRLADRSSDKLKFGDSLDVTTPLSSLNREIGRKNYSLIQNNKAKDRLALPLRSDGSSLSALSSSPSSSSSLLNSPQQSVYSTSHLSSSTSHHVASSIPPPLTSATSAPSSTISMNLAGLHRQQQFSVCSLHPLFWQRTFNLLLLGLFVLLSIVTVFCFIYVDCTRRCNQKRRLVSHTNYYLSSSSNFLNAKHKLTGVSVLDGPPLPPLEFANSRYQLKSTPSQLMRGELASKSTSNLAQATGNSPGNTNTTTTTCASDNPHHQANHGHSAQHSPSASNNRSSLQAAASLSTIALGEEQNHSDKLPYEQAGDSMSALCSMIDHDLARSTDALATKDTSAGKELARGGKDKKSKMHLLSKSQPSLLANLQTRDSLDKKGSNLSVYSFDIENKKQRRRPRSDAKLNPLASQLSSQLKYSAQLQLKGRLPMRSSSMITQNNLDDNEPFSMQSREDLFSRTQYLRDHYKICDLRWSSVVTITSLCYAVNQAPTMVSLFLVFVLLVLSSKRVAFAVVKLSIFKGSFASFWQV